MKNEIMFGILFAAIVAVGAGTLTTILDDVIQNADAAQPGGTGPPPAGQVGGGGGHKAPGQTQNPNDPKK